jgi:polysaccharide pyruvyl transferase WcaK-like protein
MGNLGNEGSLAALLLHLRRHDSAGEVRCLAGDPHAVRAEHGVPSERLMSLPLDSTRGSASWLVRALTRAWDVPRTWWLLRGTDLLVVPGMGVLESRLGTSTWGMPFWLLAAVASCRLRGGQAVLLSVGVDVPASRLTRRFFRWTLALSTHRSYRDLASQEAAVRLGRGEDPGPVLPDLAFGLDDPPRVEPEDGHVVVGVMRFEGERDTPGRGPRLVRAYADKMVSAVGRLVDSGRTVTLVVGDLADRGLAEEVASRVLAEPGRASAAVGVSAAADLGALMLEMGRAEVVVASRFHNVLCALKVGRPVVSLGYAPKNRDLQREFGLHDLDQALESFDVDVLMAHIERASATPETTLATMRATASRYRATVRGALRAALGSELEDRGGSLRLRDLVVPAAVDHPQDERRRQ